MKLMITETNKTSNIDEDDVLCMIWMNLNIVQYMITMHIINEIKEMIYKNCEKRHEIFKAAISSA
jgi:hypothetical protein